MIAYVDAFNLYYGCLKNSRHKWLNLVELCRAEFPHADVQTVRVFLARVKQRPGDPTQPARQDAYIRALQTLPEVQIHFGRYTSNKVWMPLTNPVAGAPTTVEVVKSEENGSDVNLATYLLLDAFRQSCDEAVVVTNDSDLTEPVRVAAHEFGLTVTVLHPCSPSRYPSAELSAVATYSRRLNLSLLPSSLFPPTVTDAAGRTITKPATW